MTNTQTLLSSKDLVTEGGIYGRLTWTPGSGETLVLVMGYGGSSRVWPQSLVERLSQTYRVLVYDNRGTGRSISPREAEAYTIKVMAKDLDEVVTAFGITKLHMVGYSMGSCIALQYARDYASKVESLFLICGTAGGPLYAKPAPEMSAALAKPEGKTLWEIYQSTWKLMYSPAHMERCAPQLKLIYENSKDTPTPPTALAGHSNAFRGFDASAYLSALKVPITLLAGENDRLMPIENSKNIAKAVSHARLVVVPDCEHAPHIQNEDLVVREIQENCKSK